VFARAEAAGAISLFDEADALFGKRADMTNVTELHRLRHRLPKECAHGQQQSLAKDSVEKKPPRFLAFRNIFSFNKAVSDDKSGSSSLRAALEIYAACSGRHTPLEEARILLRAACEVEHALLVEYLNAAWSVAPNPAARQILDVAIQEMCHFLTVQNLMLFLGSDPAVRRQDYVCIP
jgi:Ferritin-like